jgi:hypothetical protein
MSSTLMRSYLPVPSSWYLGLLGVNFGAASTSKDRWSILLLTYSLVGDDNAASDAGLGSDTVDSDCHCEFSDRIPDDRADGSDLPGAVSYSKTLHYV